MNKEINTDGELNPYWLYIKKDFAYICGMRLSTFRALET